MEDDGDSGHNDDFMQLSTDQKLAAMFTKISTTEVKVNSIYKEKLGRRVQKAESIICAHEQRIKLLEYRSINIEARSRRRNLLFKGIREYGQIENCFEIVRDVIADQLHINDDMYMERAHRLGRLKHNQTKPRPIIVAFRDYYDTEMILQAAPDLKNTAYSVCRDYPKEITEARNKLWPHYRKARENPSAKVSIRYPARLVINGATTHDMFPDWFRVLNGNRVQTSSETNQRNVGQHNGPNNQQLSGQQGQQSMGPTRAETLLSNTGIVSQPSVQSTSSLNASSIGQQTSAAQRQDVVNTGNLNIDDANRPANVRWTPDITTLTDQRQDASNVMQFNLQSDVPIRAEADQRPRQPDEATSTSNNTNSTNGRAVSPARPVPNGTGPTRGNASSENVR